MLDKVKQADGIFCSNEPSTFGILLALRQNNLAGSKKFVGFGTSPALVEALKSAPPICIASLAVVFVQMLSRPLFENFPVHRQRDPFFGRIRVDTQATQLIDFSAAGLIE